MISVYMRADVPQIPQPNPTLTQAQISLTLQQATQWAQGRGDELVDLDTELSQQPELKSTDLTLAFAVWTLAAGAISEASSAPLPNLSAPPATILRSYHQALAKLWNPLIAHDGLELAGNTNEAIRLVDSLIEATKTGIHSAASAVTGRTMIAEHLVTAATLSKQLDIGASELARLHQQSAAMTASSTPTEIADLAARAAGLRSDLETAAAERSRLLNSIGDETRLLDELRVLEIKARTVSTQTASTFSQPPRLGILSVDALGPTPPIPDLEGQPWPAVRTLLAARAEKLGRAKQALVMIIDRHEAMLEERISLRGMVDGYHAKTTSTRTADLPDVAAAYTSAKQLLWTAPCDLEAARKATNTYVQLVSASNKG